MNLRLPLVLSIVAVAGVAAAIRAVHPSSAAPAVAFSQDTSRPLARRTPLAERVDAHLVVYVAGAVARAGVYRLALRSRAQDALRAAGGATGAADLVAVNLAAPLADGDEVVVPEKGAADDVVEPTGSAPARKHRKRKKHHRKTHHPRAKAVPDETPDSASDPPSEPGASIDLNTADASELETLPGLGPELANRIVTFRELNGPFNAPDDLLDVGGMTQKRLEAIEPFLTSR